MLRATRGHPPLQQALPTTIMLGAAPLSRQASDRAQRVRTVSPRAQESNPAQGFAKWFTLGSAPQCETHPRTGAESSSRTAQNPSPVRHALGSVQDLNCLARCVLFAQSKTGFASGEPRLFLHALARDAYSPEACGAKVTSVVHVGICAESVEITRFACAERLRVASTTAVGVSHAAAIGNVLTM